MKMPTFLRTLINKINTFNDWFGLVVTNGVGSMWCAYLFAFYAIYTAGPVIHTLGFGNWFIEQFVQLVLLSIIMVGQNVQAKRHDALQAAHDQLLLSHGQINDKLDTLQKTVDAQ
jgi:hypothetical protein